MVNPWACRAPWAGPLVVQGSKEKVKQVGKERTPGAFRSEESAPPPNVSLTG